MKIKKSPLDYLMTGFIILVCIPLLAVYGIITYILLLIFPKKIFFLIVVFARVFILMMFVRVKKIGVLLQDLICLVAFNHESFLDYALAVYAMGYKKKWVVVYGTNLHKYPIFRLFLKRVGIGVDRKDLNSKIEASVQIKKALANGYSVAIFPEGTRMRSHQMEKVLLKFQNGTFSAAYETGKPIVPIVFSKPILFSCPDKPLPFSPRVITAIIGDPIFVGEKTRIELRDETHEIMKNMLLNTP